MLFRTDAFTTVAYFVCLLGAGSALGVAPQRTFVASYGNDTWPCSLTQPCRGFQAAINAVAAGGEVVAIDSGGYGAMEIHKSVSVIVPSGVHAGLSPSVGLPIPGHVGQSTVVLIDVQNTDVVVLRGLYVTHAGTVTGGIDWVSSQAGTVHIENTVVSGFPGEGLYVEASGAAGLHVKDSIFRDNYAGIWLRQTHFPGQSVQAMIDHVRSESNSEAGILTEGPMSVTVRNSVINRNFRGIESKASAIPGARYTVEGCELSLNSAAFSVNTPGLGGTSIYVSGSQISFSLTGGLEIIGSNGYVYSRGNNTVVGPGTTFNVTFVPE